MTMDTIMSLHYIAEKFNSFLFKIELRDFLILCIFLLEIFKLGDDK